MILLDKIIIALLCLFFLSGWMRGFLKSLIGPISFLFCFISAVIFYDLNRNILMATFIATIGTIALTITLNVLLMASLATVNKEFRGKAFLVSRILGSIINILWQGNIMFMAIILLSALPIRNEKFEILQNQAAESRILAHYYQKVIYPDNRLTAITMSLAMMRDPQRMQIITNTPEFATFYADPKVQKFINDPQVMEAMAAQNSLALIQSPSLRELVTDDTAMYQFTRLATTIYRRNLKSIGEVAKEQNKPVI